MDNRSDKSITFDKNGFCNYCTDTLKRMPSEYFPNEEGRLRLENYIKKIKEDCKDDSYDCIVGVSGGIDSSYILYLGAEYGLRMLAIHVDDGFDNPVAIENLKKLTEKTGTKMITIVPNKSEYMDVIKSFFKASVANLAFLQDNLITKALELYAEANNIKYSLDGSNIAHESILERDYSVNACDKKFIYGIQSKFGEIKIRDLDLMSLTDRYIRRKFKSKVKHFRPLNFLEYNLSDAIVTLEQYCGFEYYGGKHYESILTRFLQCYYLPVKFGKDKRKSHYSSLIISGQMTREEALELIKKPYYNSDDLLEFDLSYIAKQLGITRDELMGYIKQEPKKDFNYPHSFLNNLAPIARKIRKYIE